MIQAVAVLSVFGLGISFALLGSIKLGLARNLNIDDAQFGKLISTLMFTSLIAILIMGPLVDLLGYKPIAIIGFALGFVAVYMLVTAKSYGMAVFSCIILGVAAMSLNLGNTLLPKVIFAGNPAAAANFGNVFFGIGAFITPLIVGILLSRIGLKSTGIIIAVVLIIPIIFAVIAVYPSINVGFAVGKALGLLANPAIILSALALFCYIGLESSMGGFITTYLSSIGFEDKTANMVLSSFWIGLMIARLITSQIVTASNSAIVVTLLAIVATVSIGLMITAKSKGLGALFVFITGLAFGPLFPTVVGYAFSKTEPALYGSAFSIIFAIGLLGGITLPSAIGNFAKGKSIQQALKIAMGAAFVLFIIAIIMGRV